MVFFGLDSGSVRDRYGPYVTTGQIEAAASDIFIVEPPQGDHPLVPLDNFIATPHIAGNTEECPERVGNAAVDKVLAALGLL
jgi:D-3-phosphoglycerate dehydrogenase